MNDILGVLGHVFNQIQDFLFFDDVHVIYHSKEVRFTYRNQHYILVLKQVE